MSPRISQPVATSMRNAFDLVRIAAHKNHRISAERMAELLGVPASTFYKWVEETRMPVDKLALFEHIAGCHAVTAYLAHRAHLLVIQIPRGRGAAPRDINALQGVLNDAAGALIAFTDGTLPADATMARLTEGMEALAYHREDVRKHAQPELDLEG